jgi:two-component system phosphate regulon sensor histidine kinase PhoR
LENISCGLLISDAHGQINRVNAATVDLFDLKNNELVGKNLVDIIKDEEWQRAIKKISSEGEMLVSTTLSVGEHIVRATISPITDPNDSQFGGSVVILYDATEEFENQQARDEFIASLAQELRTPMTSIIGYVDLLLGESVGMIGDMQRKFLQRVKANIERMESLLNDLIGIAAIDAGQLEINPVTLDMAEIIEEAIISAKTQLEEKEILLQLELPEQFPAVEADPACMQQVMINLLSNATKSTPVGGIVKVRAVVTNGRNIANEEERWLRISITDSGGGIAEKDIDRVFERFYKAESPLIQGLGETGVGLSIVKYLIEAHGGQVWFDTEMGKGTTFHFSLLVSDYFNDPWEEIDVPPLDLNSDIQGS